MNPVLLAKYYVNILGYSLHIVPHHLTKMIGMKDHRVSFFSFLVQKFHLYYMKFMPIFFTKKKCAYLFPIGKHLLIPIIHVDLLYKAITPINSCLMFGSCISLVILLLLPIKLGPV